MKKQTFKILLIILAMGVGIAAHRGVASRDSSPSRASATHHRPVVQQPQIENKTTAIQVVTVQLAADNRMGGPWDRLVMQNVSARNINGYSLDYGGGTSESVDLTAAPNPIAPGAEFSILVSRPAKIVIRHVTFDDGSIEGDAVAAAEQFDRREGMKEQLERIVPLLNAAIISSDIDQLAAQIQKLPEEGKPTDRSYHVAMGRTHAKQDVLTDLERMDRRNLHVHLKLLAKRTDERMARLAKREKR